MKLVTRCLVLLSTTITTSLRTTHSAFVHPPQQSSRPFDKPTIITNDHPCSPLPSSTCLPMGLRSFIKKRLHKNDDPSDDNKSSINKKQKTKQPSPSPLSSSSPSSLSSTPTPSPSAAADDEETVAERIRRHKTGGMTEDEKESFLRKSLSRYGAYSNPIRQRLPLDENDPDYDGDSESPTPTSTPSPFPSDELWSAVIGGKRGEDILKREWEKEAEEDLESEEERKKKDYFNMVTNPTRFDNFLVVGGEKGQDDDGEEEEPVVGEVEIEDGCEESDYSNARSPTYTEESVADVIEEAKAMISREPKGNNRPTAVPEDLGSRLGQAAILREKQEEKNRRVQEVQAEKNRIFQEQRMNEFRKLQDEDILQRQLELSTKKKQKEAKSKLQQMELVEQKKKDLEVLQAGQDTFWAKQLEKERMAKEARLSDDERRIMQKEARRLAEIERAKKLRENELNRNRVDHINDNFTNKELGAEQQVKSSRDVAREKAKVTIEQAKARVVAEKERQLAENPKTLPPPVSSNPPISVPARLDLRELTRKKSSTPAPSPAPFYSTPVKEDVVKRPIRQRASFDDEEKEEVRTRPIRQQISLDNDEKKEVKRPIRQQISFDDDNQEKKEAKGPIRMKIFDSDDYEDGEDNIKDGTGKFSVPDNDIKKAARWGINLDALL